jgi:PilZ domain
LTDPKDDERGAERRRTARFPFVANAEVSETVSGAKINARVTEISLYGCYLDMINPPPVGTPVFIKVFTETAFFETSANVVYSHPNLGIGVTFRDVSPHFLPILRKWLLEAMCSAGTSEKS